jgi:NAD(P)H dehydrogenase (quinone)
MVKVLIVYATDYGSTKKMAEVVAEGVRSVADVNCVLRPAAETSEEDFVSSDAVIFGSPVHMGSLDWNLKKLIDTVCSKLWMKDAMVGKVGAVFATGGGFGGAGAGAELTMLSLLTNIAELGMIIVPLPKNTEGYGKAGLQWGPCARTGDETGQPTGFSDDAVTVARHHGANVARLALALVGKDLFTE